MNVSEKIEALCKIMPQFKIFTTKVLTVQQIALQQVILWRLLL